MIPPIPTPGFVHLGVLRAQQHGVHLRAKVVRRVQREPLAQVLQRQARDGQGHVVHAGGHLIRNGSRVPVELGSLYDIESVNVPVGLRGGI